MGVISSPAGRQGWVKQPHEYYVGRIIMIMSADHTQPYESINVFYYVLFK